MSSRDGAQREMMYCHECENEWYRDEHGLSCPECHSDFTEVIEAGHDPREDNVPDLPGGVPSFHDQTLHNHNPWAGQNVPDPDEEDISNMHYGQNGPGNFHFTFTRTMSPHGARGPQQGQNPMAGNFATMLNSILGGRPMPGPQNMPGSPGPLNPGNTPGSPFNRPRSAPGFPDAAGVPGGNVRAGGGPGFQWRITTNHGPLHPRDANHPQPQGEPFDDLNNMLQMMFGMQAGGRAAPGGQAFGGMGPLGGLFSSMLNPANARAGDAVYSQEALDRIISQLMEQNASGNAPGPATAEAIESLPKRSITDKDLGTEGKAECSICMDEVKLGDKVVELPCRHWFHGECIRAWLGEHDTCPHCREGIMPKDGPADAHRPRAPNEAPRYDQNWGQPQGQGQGTVDSPWVVPDSPTGQRRTSMGGRRQSNNSGASSSRTTEGGDQGLFNRMRNAFGGGGS